METAGKGGLGFLLSPPAGDLLTCSPSPGLVHEASVLSGTPAGEGPLQGLPLPTSSPSSVPSGWAESLEARWPAPAVHPL